MKRIVIFASGSGSNAQRLIAYFRQRQSAEVVAVYCNNPGAYVIERCKQLAVPCKIFSRSNFTKEETVLQWLQTDRADLLVLAGFLWLVPANIIRAYPDKIINIHPALLPAYGGKGMYGHHVHHAVIQNGEKESGITIHLVNEVYDKGKVLFQAKVQIEAGETADSLAAKIHQLEHAHFPQVVEEYLQSDIFA